MFARERIARFTIIFLLMTGCAAFGILRFDDRLHAQQTTDELARNDGLLQHIYRNRRQQVMLKRGLDALEEGRTSEGLSQLQRLLTRGEDGFLWSDNRYTSIRQEVVSRLDRLSADESKVYNRLFGPEAEMTWQRAVRDRDPRLHHEICQQFLHTSTGFRAANQLATQWLDQGHPLQAAELWDHLRRIDAHRSRVNDVIRLKAMIAWQVVGETEKVEEWKQGLNPRHALTLGGKTMPVEDWLKQPTFSRAFSSAGSPTIVRASFDASHSNASFASPPYWMPQWVHPFQLWDSTAGSTVLANWEQSQSDDMIPLSVCNFPLAARNAIYVRSPDGILALDQNRGGVLWSYRAESSLSRLVEGTPGSLPSLRIDHLNHAYANNSLMGTLTSDGERLYAIDGVILSPPKHRHGGGANPPRIDEEQLAEIEKRGINRLIALPLDSTHSAIMPVSRNAESISRETKDRGRSNQFRQIEPVWSIGGKPRDAADQDALAGHFFLGPPVAVQGVLYVLSEIDRQINLLALSAKTGELIWSQGLCFVDLPIGVETRRFLQSATPIYSQGVLICPTLMQSLIAVQVHSGSLLWAVGVGDRGFEFDNGRWPNSVSHRSAKYPFTESLLIEGNRILYLPHDSDTIHCLDLTNGKTIWKSPVKDTEYLAAIDDDTILAVGRRYSRGLSLETGEERWNTWLGTPSGRGTRIGSTYLIPLEEGRISNLDISTGREVGVSREGAYQLDGEGNAGTVTRWRPGNLIVAGEHVYSVGLKDITSFPQAAARLKQINNRVVTRENAIEHQLLTAELELTLGYFPEARKRLERLLTTARDTTHRPRIESSLRALLYAELKDDGSDRSSLLTQLSRLSHAPEDRARYLTFKAEHDLQQRELEGVLQACTEFASLKLPDIIADSGNPEHWISASSWVPGMIERLRHEINANDADRLRAFVDEHQQAVLTSGNTELLERFLMVYAQWPQAASVRLELARLYYERGDYQKAELRLLPVRESGLPTVAAEAARQLFEIWSTAGLRHEASDVLLELKTRFGDVTLADGMTGEQYARRVTDRPLAELLENHKPLPWKVNRVEIRGSLEPQIMINPANGHQFSQSGPIIRAAYEKYQRKLTLPSHSTFYMLEKAKTPDSQLAVIDKHRGMVMGTIEVDPQYFYATIGSDVHVGHFFPLGSIGRMHGISLLEYQTGKPFWTTSVPQQFGRHESMRVGPVTHNCCLFQTRQSSLVAVDPVTGKIRWLRNDLLPTSGLGSDSSAGIIGDDQALVVFHTDHTHYSMYQTQTGNLVRHGALEIDSSQPRMVIGRKLLHFTPHKPRQEMRIWDPLTDQIELRESIHGRAFSLLNSDREILLITSHHELKVIDLETRETILSMQLEPKQLANLSYLRAFRDGDRYFVNFQEAVRFTDNSRSSYYASDTFLPADHVQGTLWCVDAQTGKLLWQRNLPQRSILRIERYNLPFLVAMSRERGQTDGTKQSLAIEVIDRETGTTIGYSNNLFQDKIIQMQYDRREGRLTLQGIKSEVELLFDRPRQAFTSGDETL